MVNGNELERYFSDIDDLYERAFSEGYEYAQREFALSQGLKNRIKAIPRHLKRDVEYGKSGIEYLVKMNKPIKNFESFSRDLGGIKSDTLQKMENLGRTLKTKSKTDYGKKVGQRLASDSRFMKFLRANWS